MKHSLTEVDEESRTALCAVCGPTNIALRDNNKIPLASKYKCNFIRNKVRRFKDRPYTRYRKEFCEACGFIPEHYSQLDVDHIDGNNNNNDPSNLQTLCANCHRLKTIVNRDWKPNRI